MRLPNAIMALLGTALCSIRGISEASIQCIEEDNGKKCPLCLKSLLSSAERKEVAYLAACQYPRQHVFHAKCLAKAFVYLFDGMIICPVCRGDCRTVVRQALTNHQDRGANKSLQQQMLMHMDALPNECLREMLGNINFAPSDYECLAENLANTNFSRVKNAVARHTSFSIYKATDPCKYLVSKDAEYASAITYKVALTKYFVGDASVSQIMAILERILRVEYGNDMQKCKRAASLTIALLGSPHIWLPNDDVYTIVLKMLNNGIVRLASIMLLNTEAVHTISTDQALEILRHCLSIGGPDGMFLFKYVWFHGIYLRNLGPRKISQIKQNINEHLEMIDATEDDTVRETLGRLYYMLSKKPLSAEEIIIIIMTVSDKEMQALSTFSTLDYLMAKGVISAMACMDQEEQIRIFRCMLDWWTANLFKIVYMSFPESVATVEIDLALLRQFVAMPMHDIAELSSCITTLVRRRYFGYGMFMRMLDILSSAEDEEPFYIWLLLVAKHRGFFENLSIEESNALFEKLAQARLFWGIALLEKPLDGNEERKRLILENTESIVRAFPRFLDMHQVHIACQYTDTYIFAIWSERIVSLVKYLLEGMVWDDALMDIDLFIMSICGSAYFANNVLKAEVKELMKVLLSHGSAALRYVDTFIMVARSEQHVHAAKVELFKALAAQQLTEEDVAAMNAIGFDFKLTDSKITYLMDDGGVGVLASDNIDEPIAKMIGTVGGHCLLKLLQNKME